MINKGTLVFLIVVFFNTGKASGAAYPTLGCYKDTGTRAIQPLEGTDPILDGAYWTRTNPVEKCARATARAGFHVFAVQNGGWCVASATAEQTFDKYGLSSACNADGEGGRWANQVYVLKGYYSIGCYKDTGNRAIQPLEGTDPTLDGTYWTRSNPIAKCAVAATRAGFQMFAVQNGGWCAASATAEDTFDKYGSSSACNADGEGGGWANQVYVLKGYDSIGCYKDTGNRAIQSLEGTDPILDGNYGTRMNPIAKCAEAAARAGFHMFAVQNGGWCAASATAEYTFDRYGLSTACHADGEGGGWANQVYVLRRGYHSLGCYIDTGNRAIHPLEGTDPILDGSYLTRTNPVAKCAAAATRAGFHMFAVQNGGWCAASATAEQTFDKYGSSSACKADGEGGGWANQVYVLKDYQRVSCYGDTSNRAMPTLEGHASVLDGSYQARAYAIVKCAVAARARGDTFFGVQNGGWCAGAKGNSYAKYGHSSACKSDGKGGPWANQVYILE